MPGLYGGTNSDTTCDRDQMARFLAANPVLAQAWTDALNSDPTLKWSGGTRVEPSQIGAYLDELTPVILRNDVRVTNHGFANGRLTSRQAVMQAGTAVLVDVYGMPRARCKCGNPLTQPVAVTGQPTYVGPQWPGFSPGRMTAVAPAAQPITVIVVVNVNTGELEGRPVGTTELQPPPTDVPTDVSTTFVDPAFPEDTPSPESPAVEATESTPGPLTGTPTPGAFGDTFCEVFAWYNDNGSADFNSAAEALAYIRRAFDDLAALAPPELKADAQLLSDYFRQISTLSDWEFPAAVEQAWDRMAHYATTVCGIQVE